MKTIKKISILLERNMAIQKLLKNRTDYKNL